MFAHPLIVAATGAVLASLHATEMAVWAITYLSIGAMGSWTAAVLYSIDSMTTRGASGLDLADEWRLMGALKAADGMLLFGISTAFLLCAAADIATVGGQGTGEMIARPVRPGRHFRSYGDDPLPSGREALDAPFSAFPSWFLRVECDRCGKMQMVNQAHQRWDDMPIRDVLARMRHDSCGGRPSRVELLTGIEAASSRPVRRIVLIDG